MQERNMIALDIIKGLIEEKKILTEELATTFFGKRIEERLWDIDREILKMYKLTTA